MKNPYNFKHLISKYEKEINPNVRNNKKIILMLKEITRITNFAYKQGYKQGYEQGYKQR